MRSTRAENSNGKPEGVMNLAIELKAGLAELAGPLQPSDTRESWLARGARRAGVSHRTARAIYYGETTDPRTSVSDRIRAAVTRLRGEQLKRAQHEHQDILGRIARLERHLSLSDPDFHEPALDALRQGSAVAGREDRSGN